MIYKPIESLITYIKLEEILSLKHFYEKKILNSIKNSNLQSLFYNTLEMHVLLTKN